jgi:hypothetical protein
MVLGGPAAPATTRSREGGGADAQGIQIRPVCAGFAAVIEPAEPGHKARFV